MIMAQRQIVCERVSRCTSRTDIVRPVVVAQRWGRGRRVMHAVGTRVAVAEGVAVGWEGRRGGGDGVGGVGGGCGMV